MVTRDHLSILLLDDNQHLVALYKNELERLGHFAIRTETNGQRARQIAQAQLFDIIVIDAKLEYRGLEFGGVQLADDLRSRYGTHSILIVSRLMTADLIRDQGCAYDFVERNTAGHLTTFIKTLRDKIKQMRRRQFVFVAMPFDDELNSLYQHGIKVGIEKAGFKCVRADDVAHNRPICDVIFELVEKSKMVMFVADNGSANAYYEAGFATAMRKEVMMIAKSMDEMKFDVAHRHAILYGSRRSSLPNEIRARMRALRLNDLFG